MSIANSPISTALYIDTHCHIDGEEFDEDREAVVQRAREAGVGKVFVPAIDLKTSQRILSLCAQYADYLYPMVGLHPEEVRADWREQLEAIKSILPSPHAPHPSSIIAADDPLSEGAERDGSHYKKVCK